MSVYERRFGPYPLRNWTWWRRRPRQAESNTRDSSPLPPRCTATPGHLTFFEFATAHETAHQWFYLVIGSDQVNHPWLDESLVEYATLIYFQDRYRAAEGQKIQDLFFDRQYEAAKAKYGDRPAGLPISAYDENAYGAFVYAKGPKFFQAVREQIGDDLFFKSLQTY